MKKKLMIILFLFILFPINALADDIYSIDMDIYLDELGNANITEEWSVKADSGSEWYKQLYNMGNQEISNFTVSMDGNPLEYKEWNINESISQKNGYYGINYVSECIELCFGKSDFDYHTFTLNYTLSNFIVNTDDSQVLYETLFPNVTMNNFTVEVSSYYTFPDTLDVWGYGYKGYAYVEDGKIKMSNEGELYNDYVVLLVKFPLDTFKTDNTDSRFNEFNDVYDIAEEGTYEYDYSNNDDDIFNFIGGIFAFLFNFGIPIFIIAAAAKATSINNYGYKDNKVIDKKNTPFFRDIPCDKDIYYANALINLNNFGYKESNILGAIILKWIRSNKISFRNTTTGVFNKETSAIDLTKNPTFDNPLEQELFNIMYQASGDGILETKEFEKWSRKHYSKFFSLFDKIKNTEINNLKMNNHIYKRTTKEECKQKNVMDDMIYEDSIKLYGLKKYLQAFSNIDTKEVMEVHLWDEYLMFAYLFGMADKVAKQLNHMYPEVAKEMSSYGVDYNTLLFINTMSTRSVSAASSARSAAESYSSGGGGFSSGGGGGGSFGGGGSMGGR